MKVLLSIKPEFALRILDGSKKYEYRRSIFKRSDVKTVVLYASHPVKKVIGEFEVGDILYDEPQALWVKTRIYAGLSKKRFLEYFTGRKRGYAIGVKSIAMYDTPFPLKNLMILSPPQSFMYLP